MKNDAFEFGQMDAQQAVQVLLVILAREVDNHAGSLDVHDVVQRKSDGASLAIVARGGRLALVRLPPPKLGTLAGVAVFQFLVGDDAETKRLVRMCAEQTKGGA